MRFPRWIAPLAITLALTLPGSAWADGHDNGDHHDNGKHKGHMRQCAFAVIPGVFDPNHTGSVFSAWVPGVGLPDDQGRGNYGLVLRKTSPTATNASAGAEIAGVAGLMLTEL